MATDPNTTPAPSTGPSGTQQALAVLAGLAPGLIARFAGGNNSPIPPELSQVIQQQSARTQYQNPLFAAASNQAFMGLPTYARQGLSMPTGGIPNVPMPTSSPTGGSTLGKLGAGALGAGLGALASNPSDLGKLLSALKNLFGGKGNTLTPTDDWWTNLTKQGPEQDPFAWMNPTGHGQIDPNVFNDLLSHLNPNVTSDWNTNWTWPEQTPNPLDPHQLPNYSDPMADYNRWLAQQSQQTGGTSQSGDQWTGDE